MEKVKVSPDVAKALDDMFHDKDLDKEKIFFHHRINLQGNGWVSELYKPLNNVSLDAMYEILEWGYEASADRPEPKTPQIGDEIKLLNGRYEGEVCEVTDVQGDAFEVDGEAWHVIGDEGVEWQFSNTRPTPKTPRQMGAQIVRLTQPNARCQVKPTPEQSTAEALQAELDYELASLHHAINEGDEVEIARSKQRLKEIHEEMEGLGC